MRPHGKSDTGVDAGRNEAVLKIAEPERSRVRLLAARGLAAVLLAAFAALLVLPSQALAQNSAPTFDDGTSTSREFNETIGEATVTTASDIGMRQSPQRTRTPATRSNTPWAARTRPNSRSTRVTGKSRPSSGKHTTTRRRQAMR